MSQTVPNSMPASGSSTPVPSGPASASEPVLPRDADAGAGAGAAVSPASAAAQTYTAPPIPSSFRTSLSAWWKAKPVEDAAQAELHLYRSSGYFSGATVGNVPNDEGPIGEGRALARAFERAQGGATATHAGAGAGADPSVESEGGSRLSWLWRKKEEDRCTVATRAASDGKVGCIRYVDLGRAGLGSATGDGASSPLAWLRDKVHDVKARDEPPVAAGASSANSTVAGDPPLNDNFETRQDHDQTAALVGGGGYTPPSGRKLNMLEIGLPYTEANRTAISQETKVVLLHGYGAGTAFFYQNLGALASLPRSRLYALDWLGMGRSSRPSFHIPAANLKTPEARVQAAEAFFVDSLEEWRRKLGLDRMVLVGHSLGGYLSLAYALRYPARVERLVLISPVGIPREPEEPQEQGRRHQGLDQVEKEVKVPQDEVAPSSAAQERQSVRAAGKMAHSEASIVTPSPTSGSSTSISTGSSSSSSTGSGTGTNPPASPALNRTDTADSSHLARSGQTTAPERASHQPRRLTSKTARNVLTFLWEQNFSPFGLLRGSVFLGPYLAGRYTARRFAALPADELATLHSYCQAIFLSKGSGEYCLAHLLKPGAYARLPMVERVARLRGTGMGVTFMYGEQDWMDVSGGKRCVKILRQGQGQGEGEGEGKRAKCFVVPKSGHHLYLDNPAAFGKLVVEVLKGETD